MSYCTGADKQSGDKTFIIHYNHYFSYSSGLGSHVPFERNVTLNRYKVLLMICMIILPCVIILTIWKSCVMAFTVARSQLSWTPMDQYIRQHSITTKTFEGKSFRWIMSIPPEELQRRVDLMTMWNKAVLEERMLA